MINLYWKKKVIFEQLQWGNPTAWWEGELYGVILVNCRSLQILRSPFQCRGPGGSLESSNMFGCHARLAQRFHSRALSIPVMEGRLIGLNFQKCLSATGWTRIPLWNWYPQDKQPSVRAWRSCVGDLKSGVAFRMHIQYMFTHTRPIWSGIVWIVPKIITKKKKKMCTVAPSHKCVQHEQTWDVSVSVCVRAGFEFFKIDTRPRVRVSYFWQQELLFNLSLKHFLHSSNVFAFFFPPRLKTLFCYQRGRPAENKDKDAFWLCWI